MAEEKKSSSEPVLSNPPHIKDNQSVKKIMWFVVLALMPSNIYAVYLFGLSAFILLIVSVISAVAAETLYQLLMKKPLTLSDGSAVITGLLVAMNVPPEAPAWMVGIGSFFAIIIVKQLFGGLGFNIFNPALAARAFMIASWPVEMTTKWARFGSTNVIASDITNQSGLPEKVYDAITQATPLSALKEIPNIVFQNGVSGSVDKVYDLLLSTDMIQSLFKGNI